MRKHDRDGYLYKDHDVTKWIFITLGIACYVGYFVIEDTSYQIFKDILSVAGGLLIVTGLVDMTLRKTYLGAILRDIINGFYLHGDSLDKMDDTRIKDAIRSMYAHLSEHLKNETIKTKITELGSEKLLKILVGESEEDNSYFTRYKAIVNIDKQDTGLVKVNYYLDYEIVNNTDEKITHKVFMKRGFPTFQGLKAEDTQILKNLKITVDDQKQKDYSEEISQGKFKAKLTQRTASNINTYEAIYSRILYGYPDGAKSGPDSSALSEFNITFKDRVHLTKELEILTSSDDVMFTHKFHRPTMNMSFSFEDKNASKVHVLQYLNFADQEKINITDISDNHVIIDVSDLIFPGQGVSFILQK